MFQHQHKFELFDGHGVGPLVAIENLSDHDAHCAADDLTVVGARTAHCAHQFTADPGEVLCLKYGQTMTNQGLYIEKCRVCPEALAL